MPERPQLVEPIHCEDCRSRQKSLFHFCAFSELHVLDLAKTCTEFRRGNVLFNEGGNPIGLYCINKGKIKVSKAAADGREQITRIAGPGEFVGYSSVILGSHYQVSASALEDSTVCMIPKARFLELFKSNNRFNQEIVGLLCRTIHSSRQKEADMAYKPVRGRMAEALLILHESYKDEDNPEGIISISRDDLASLTGTVKETAIRCLKELKDAKLVSTDKREIHVLNKDALRDFAELYD